MRTVLLLFFAGVILASHMTWASVREMNWSSQPSWLSNPSDEFSIKKTEAGVCFRVKSAGRGMKWSAPLLSSVDLSERPWAAIRYRAVDVAPPSDYFIYLGGAQEQNIGASEIIPDGEWHIMTARAKPFTAEWVAIHVQAITTRAYVEIDSIEFYSEKPRLHIRDFLPIGKRRSGKFQPVNIATICTESHEALLADLDLADWFPKTRTAVCGVPFELPMESPDTAVTPLEEPGELRLSVSGISGSELFFLAGLSDETTEIFSEPHLCSVRVSYEDGWAEECVPAGITGGFGLKTGIGVYAVALSSSRTLREVVIRESIKDRRLSLIGVTIGKDTNLAPHARPPVLRTPVPYKPCKYSSGPQWEKTISAGGNRITFSDGHAKVTFHLTPGVSIEIVPNGPHPRLSSRGSLWEVRVGEKTFRSTDFVGELAETVGGYASIRLSDRFGLGIHGSLRISPWRAGCLDLGLELESSASDRITVRFPVISVSHAEGEPLSYCFPCRGAVVNDMDIHLRAPYSGLMPLQFMDVYGPDGGIYILTRDLVNTYRYFELRKSPKETLLAVEYLEHDFAGGARYSSIATVIGFHQGDWHTALDAYKDWLAGWYKPDAPRKDWFRRVFNFRQQFLHKFFVEGTYYNEESGTLTFAAGVERDTATFGGIDYLHFFDWGMSRKRADLGNYDCYDEIGGLEAFRESIQGLQQSGLPMGLYIEGYLVHPDSEIGRKHGKEWQILDVNGEPLRHFAPAMKMCSAVLGWQEYLAGVYARVKNQTGAMGYYCDEMGFADPGHFCYAKNHGHAVPEPPLRGQGELLRRIRAVLGPEVVLYTEETPADVNTQHQDGSFTYNITFTPDEWSPSHINLTRFALPDFKTFEIIRCDSPLGDRLTSVRQIFFNGEGIWLEGPPEWFSPSVLEFIRRMHAVMIEYADCFTSLSPIPLVPTAGSQVFANEFPGECRTLWTLFNSGYTSVRGELIAVAHTPGARYRDAWNNRELKPRIEKGTAYIQLELGPRGSGCVVQILPSSSSDGVLAK